MSNAKVTLLETVHYSCQAHPMTRLVELSLNPGTPVGALHMHACYDRVN